MKKKILLIVLFLIGIYVGATQLKTKDMPEMGRYIYKSIEQGTFSEVQIMEDQRFTFSESITRSYLPNGEYEQKGNQLILREVSGKNYSFIIRKNTLVFQGESDVVPEGAVFILEK